MTINWFPLGLKPKETPDDGPRYADLYERGLACAVDITILFMLLSHIFNRISAQFYTHADRAHLIAARDAHGDLAAIRELWAAGLPQLWALNAVLQILVMGFFIVGCQLNWDTTPGKWLLGLSIRRAGDTEQLPGAWRYILRYLGYIVAAPLFFVVSFTRRHRGLHDYIADTVVIHTRPKYWYWEQFKLGLRWARTQLNSAPVEDAVGQPPAGERHQDRADAE